MEDYSRKTQELLKSADRAFDADNIREGSRLMWEATRTGVSAVAAKHGWPCDSLDEIKEVMYRLDSDGEEWKRADYPWHFAQFTVADIFREHAETDEWEHPEFQWSEPEFRMGRKSIKRFIALLIEYAAYERKAQ